MTRLLRLPATIFLGIGLLLALGPALAEDTESRHDVFEVNWADARYPRPKVRVDVKKYPDWRSNIRVVQDLQIVFDKIYVAAYAEAFCKNLKPIDPCLKRFQDELVRRERWVLSRRSLEDLVPSDERYFDSANDQQDARAVSIDVLAREMVLAAAVDQSQKYLREFDEFMSAEMITPNNFDALEAALTRAEQEISAIRSIASPLEVSAESNSLFQSKIKLGVFDLYFFIWTVVGVSMVSVIMALFSGSKKLNTGRR